MRRFLIYLLALGAAMMSFIYLGQSLELFSAPRQSMIILLYMMGSTAAIFYLLHQQSGPVLFTQLYLLTIVLKMLTGSIVLLLIIYLDRPSAFANATLFIISYILFTSLEVIFLYKKTTGPVE